MSTEILDYIKKSFELKNQGFYKPAIDMLYKALNLDNDNVEILTQLAHLYNLLENKERAVYYIEKALEVKPNHLDSLNLLQDIYYENGQFDLAKNTCEKICEIQITPAIIAKKLNILNKLNYFEEIKDIENSIIEPNDEILYEFAITYQNKDLNKTIDFLEKGLQINPKNEKILELLGKIYYENEDFEKSKSIFTNLLKDSENPIALNYLGLFCLDEQNFSKAIDYFSKARKIDEKNPEYAYNLASAFFLNGWLDEALKLFNISICLSPKNNDYHYALAYLYFQKGEYDKSLNEIKTIKETEPQHELSNILEAMIDGKNGDLLGAKTKLEKILKYNDDDFGYFALSTIYKELLQLDLAEKSIEKALSMKPDTISYLNGLMELKIDKKEYEKAQEIISKILEINDKYLPAYSASAKIQLAQNDYENLYETAQDMIELDANSAQGYYYNSIALFEQGDKDFALESLKKSISLDLNNAALYIKMSEFMQDLGDIKQAYEWANEASLIDEKNYKYKWLCAKLAVMLKNNDEALKNYSQSYRIASFDEELNNDYAKFLNSIGKEKQAKKILTKK